MNHVHQQTNQNDAPNVQREPIKTRDGARRHEEHILQHDRWEGVWDRARSSGCFPAPPSHDGSGFDSFKTVSLPSSIFVIKKNCVLLMLCKQNT